MTAAPAAGDLALACASLLVDELARAGVRRVCVSPGSRSTPLALAVARHPAISTLVVLDERSAGFVALGMASATGAPAAVVCTSGTAAAGHHPAVVEAFQARVPLVVLTADRPPELRDVGANQAIDQLRLHGGAVRWFCDAEVPALRSGAARYWRSLGARAAAEAAGPPPGPVHLNLPFREPLVPRGDPVDLGQDAGGRGDALPWHRVAGGEPLPGDAEVAALASELDAPRGLLVAGGLRVPAPAVAELAASRGWPLLAEPHSGLRGTGALRAGSVLAGAIGDELVPAVVVQVGAAPTSRATQELAARSPRLVVIDPDSVVGDPGRRAALTLRCAAQPLAEAVLARSAPRPRSDWLAAWRQADVRVRAILDATLDGWGSLSELGVARDVAAAVPDGGLLVAGSSMPVRDLDWVMAPRQRLRVLANRGASGIDGLVSTALGAALAHGGPSVALLGDLSLLHDAGALLWLGRSPIQCVLVVVDNRGGGIFNLVGQDRLAEFEQLFGTPHRVDLAALAAAAGVAWHSVERPERLGPAVGEAVKAGGVRLLAVRTDRAQSAVQHHALARAAREALRGRR